KVIEAKAGAYMGIAVHRTDIPQEGLVHDPTGYYFNGFLLRDEYRSILHSNGTVTTTHITELSKEDLEEIVSGQIHLCKKGGADITHVDLFDCYKGAFLRR